MNWTNTFSLTELKVLREEVAMRVNDWQDALKDDPECTIIAGRLAIVMKLHNALKEEISRYTITTRAVYAEHDDLTFIMQDTWEGDDLKSSECVGWYHGGSNPKDTTQYSSGHMKATYDM